MHVLLIEPDRIHAAAVRQALERADHTVSHVVSAQGAIHAADERVPDVVVLELQLPRHNGVEFLYEFRSYEEWLEVPVVVYTMVRPDALAEATTLPRELGVRRVLYKPTTSLAQLCAALQLIVPASHA